MFNSLTLKQRVLIQLILNISLQVVIVTGVLMNWDKLPLLVSSLAIGVFMLWLYLDSAMASGQFVTELISGAQRMGQGDLTRDVEVAFGNPTLREGLGTMQALQVRIRTMLGALNDGARQVSNASSEIAAGNQDLSTRTEQGSAELQAAASAMRQLTEAASHSAQSVQQATRLSQQTAALVHSSGDVVGQAVAAMGEVSSSSHKIADIISVIDGIAFQTNILALNAAVEAARAGEQGRGFAVVASEVRSLAGRSAEAAKEIKALINTSVEQVEKGASLVNTAGEKMGEVVKAIESVTSLISEATAMSSQQSNGLQDIASTLDRLDGAMQQNAALVEQEAAAAESLRTQSQKLHALVAEFKLPAGQTSAHPQQSTSGHQPRHVPKPAPPQRPQARVAAAPRKKLAGPSAVPKQTSLPKPAASAGNDEWETF
jgi:methyl-accepting chemotaxis protein